MADAPQPEPLLMDVKAKLRDVQQALSVRTALDEKAAHALRDLTSALGMTLTMLERQPLDAPVRRLVARLVDLTQRVAQQIDASFPRDL